MRDPFVIAVVRAHRWFKDGQLAVRWPNPPEALLRGLEVYDAALNRVVVHDLEADRKRSDVENDARLAELEANANIASINRPLVRRR